MAILEGVEANTRLLEVGSLTMRPDDILHVVFDFETPSAEAAA